MGARETALNALIACRREGAWSNSILKECLKRDRLDPRDAALATRLCYGVLQNRGLLDFYLRQVLTSGRPEKLHPALRDILHLGLYQLRLSDRIPDRAAVSESVSMASKYCAGQKNAAGLTNAVLRSAAAKQDWTEPVSYADRYSHPDPLISLLKKALPKGMLEPMLIADNQAPGTLIQVNRVRTDAEGLLRALEAQGAQAEPHGWMPDCYTLTARISPERLDAFRDGLFYVQDPAAKLSVLCAALEPGMRVLDCCAAPGGKSFAAAIAMQDNGQIVSCDLYPHKIPLIESGAARLGLKSITARCLDALTPMPEWHGSFDAVIADVPCSGLGIIRKKPDIRYKDLSELAALPALQRQILEARADCVAPGGVLVYSTCTVLPEENEHVVRSFLDGHPEFVPEPLPLPAGLPGGSDGMLTLIPGQYDTDGFFISRLRRTK